MNTLQWRWWLCVHLRWLNVWNGCRVGPTQTVRTFACGNSNDGFALIFVRWICEMGAVLALNKQLVHAFVLLCACSNLKMLLVSKQCSMRSYFYTRHGMCWSNTLLQWWRRRCVDLCLLNVWLERGVSCWPWMIRPYVYAAMCVIEFEGANSAKYSMMS